MRRESVRAEYAIFGVLIVGLGACKRDVNSREIAPAQSASASASTSAIADAAGAIDAASRTCPASMATIPSGVFEMGTDEKDALDFERPAHRVTLGAYCIDVTEVTVQSYAACVDAGKCAAAEHDDEDAAVDAGRARATACNARDPAKFGMHPINCVDWEQANAYCRFRATRLPTEAEWENAARGEKGRIYAWGDDPPTTKRLNACGNECVAWKKHERGVDLIAMYAADDGFVTTAPVGSFPKGASRYGLMDVAGNVWEWVADWSGPFSADDARDPEGPKSGTARVLRGGAWDTTYTAWVRSTFRYREVPTKRSDTIGFRCARDL